MQTLTTLATLTIAFCAQGTAHSALPQVAAQGPGNARKPSFPSPALPTFGPGADHELAGEQIADPEVNDFDGDGWLDLAVSSHGGEITVLYGDGTGSLSDNENFWAVEALYDPGPGGIGSADFDGNGHPDLAVSVAGSYDGLGQTVKKAHIYLTDADRNWTYSTTVTTHAPFANDAAGGDFDEDGHADLAVISSSGFDVFLGRGDGTCGPAIPLQGSNPPTGFRIVAADVDADGHLDLVAGFGSTFPGTRVYWGDGTGVYSSYAFAGPGYNFAVGDLDRDGFLDTISAVITKFPNYTGGLWVSYGGPQQTMSFGGRYGPTFLAPGRVVAADFNADGLLDIAARDSGGTRLFLAKPLFPVFLGQPTWTLVEKSNATPFVTAPGSPASGDWNHDGLADLAFPWEVVGQTPMVRVFLNQTL